MSFSRITEKSEKTVASRKSSISFLRLCMLPKSIFYSNFTIVEDDLMGNSAQDIKSTNECIQKTFLILMTIGKYNWSTAVTKPRTEKIDHRFLTVEINRNFSPVHLHCLARFELKRNKCFRFAFL